MIAAHNTEQVAARLDRLPISRFHRRFLILVSLGAWFDYFDNFIAGSLNLILVRAHVLRPAQPGEWISEAGLFAGALPLGMFLGTLVLGLAVDRLGRRLGFLVMLLLYSVATFIGGAGYYPLVAVAGLTAGLVLLLVTRALAGAGIGGENVVIDAYVTELVPARVRGRAVAFAHGIAFTAVPVAALAARLLAPEEAPHGWWRLLVLGSLGALLVWYLRRAIPESPRWLASRGRTREADALLTRIENEVQRETGQPLPPPAPAAPQATTTASPWRIIWSRAYRGRTVLLIAFQLLQTVGYYGFMHWLPSLLEAKGFSHNEALTMQLWSFFLAPVGPLLAVWSIERWQRKYLIVGLTAALAALHLAFGLAGGQALLILIGAAVVVGSNWFSAVFHAYQGELFPTEARATGIGFTYAWSRASMVAVSLVMPGLIAMSPLVLPTADLRIQLPVALVPTTAAFLGVAVLIGLFGPLTNNQPLESISPGGREGEETAASKSGPVGVMRSDKMV